MQVKKKKRTYLQKSERCKKFRFSVYDTKLRSDFVQIPNVVCNSLISVQAKYLYGFIQSESYFGSFDKSINDICIILDCCESSARKYLDELEQHHFIGIIIKSNKRIVYPLITKENIIDERKSLIQQESNLYYERVKLINNGSLNVPQSFLNFIDNIK